MLMAITTHNLTVSFGNIRAVDNLSLDVPAGSVFGFLGPNGAGKTTTIHLLLGLLAPQSGDITVFGHDLRTESHLVRAETGALLEHAGLYERLTAENNLEFAARIWRLSPEERRERIRENLSHFGLWERRKDRVATWSRGMKQKLAIARAMLHRPRLIFLDEPTAGLDPVAAAAIRDDITRLVGQDGTTVFLTTHNLAEAEKICNLVGVINHGKLVSLGHPDDLRRRAAGSQVTVTGSGITPNLCRNITGRYGVSVATYVDGDMTLTMADDAPLNPLTQALLDAGVEITGISRATASLEEAFMKIMEENSQ